MLEEGNYTLTNECTIYMISLYLKNITDWLDNLQKVHFVVDILVSVV